MSTIIPKWQVHEESLEALDSQLVVTIDGPAGVGKSTLAKRLAAHLGYTYLDTGALYRGIAWKVKARNVDPTNLSQVEELLTKTTLGLTTGDHTLSVYVDKQDVTHELRSLAVSQLASTIAAHPPVRAWLLAIQRDFADKGGIVAEGRDMGTKVFPHAQVKFFLEADPDVRINRRYQELQEDDRGKNWDEVQREMAIRDERDRSREVAPLFPAADAIIIDTSNLSIDQVLTQMTEVVAAHQ
ncbi:MAG: (d)CMP kinase [Nitrospirales bacterium]